MKAGYIITLGWLLVCGTILLGSCDRDKEHNTSRQYRFTVKAVDPDPQNVEDNLFIYVFNQQNKLENIVKCQLNKEIAIDAEYEKNYTFVALGYSSQMDAPDVEIGTPIEQALITLPTNPFDNINVTPSSGDIFYGSIAVSEGCKDVSETIWIKRKVAALTIITRNLQSALNTTDVDFNYVVGKTYGTFGLNGQYGGVEIAYNPLSHFAVMNNDFIAPMFYTFAAQQGEGFCIAIYKGTGLIKTYCADSNEQPFLLQEGKHTVVWIDFDNIGNDGYIDITCQIRDWTNDDINEGFN